MTQYESHIADAQRNGDMTATDESVSARTSPRRGTATWFAVAGELLGSFLVCFAIFAAYAFGTPLYGTNLAFIAIATAVAYALVSMTFRSFSRVQLNPAVTLASVLTSKTHVLDGILYVVAQLLGAVAAAAAFRSLLPVSKTLTRKLWLTYAVNGFDKGSVSYSSLNGAGATFGIAVAIAVEIVASLIIVSASIASTDAEGVPTSRHAMHMGIAYGLGAAITFPVTGAALNPARATGIALFAEHQGLSVEPLSQLWVFWIAPVLAAAVVSLVLVAKEIFSDNAAVSSLSASVADDGYEADKTDATEQTVEQTEEVRYADDADEPTASVQYANAEVQHQQTDAQGDSNESVKTD